jgi:outer membrane beta-barrel protein
MFNPNESRSRSRSSFLVFAAALVSLSCLASDAMAQQVRAKFNDKIHVVQPKPVLQKGRFEFAPRFGASVNDDIYRHFKVGVQGNYHIAESFYVGAMFDWFDFGDALGGVTSSYESIANQTGASADTPVVKWAGGLEVGFVPFVGKFSFFNSAIVYYDFALTAGGAYINAESLGLPGAKGTPGGTVSLSSRFFLNKWLALNMEVRDLIFTQDLIGSSGTLANVVTIGGGLSVFLPTSFEYSDSVADESSD